MYPITTIGKIKSQAMLCFPPIPQPKNAPKVEIPIIIRGKKKSQIDEKLNSGLETAFRGSHNEPEGEDGYQGPLMGMRELTNPND